jgi:Universal stress protein family
MPHLAVPKSLTRSGSSAIRGSGKGGGNLYKFILLPTDGSELATRAVAHGIAFAKEIGARTTAVTVLATKDRITQG